MKFLAVCSFGIEAILKREMETLGLNITSSSNGKIYFEGTQEAMIKANLHLRTAERVFVVLGEGEVKTYDELFDLIKTLDLKTYLSQEGKYLIQAKSVKSKLFSPRDLQSITKKALIENLRIAYKKELFPEEKERYAMLLDLNQDQATLLLDTSGTGLHKRGYRLAQGEAPLKETLAAALVLLSFFEDGRIMYDPFCGSGTIPIEAAMIAKNMAPGLNRHFDFEHFYWLDKAHYKATKKAALLAINHDSKTMIYASDIDQNIIEVAEENAIEAGVDDIIEFEVIDFALKRFDQPYGMIISNPPYGERLESQADVESLYKAIGKTMKTIQTYSVYILSSVNGVEGLLGKKAARTRVLFNGNIKTRFYQYYGPKPD